MKLIVRYGNKVPAYFDALAMTLYPFVLFVDKKENVTADLLVHEAIHVRQVRREGILKFYLKYYLDWFKLLRSGLSREDAYWKIPYEVEAYELETKTKLTLDEVLEFGQDPVKFGLGVSDD